MIVEAHADSAEGPRLVGTIYSHRRRGVESATFTYDPGWIGSPVAYPLEPALPLRAGTFATPIGRPLFGCFADSAPDRWGRFLIRRRERRRAERAESTARSFGEMDVLLGVRDDLRQGALRFRQSGSTAFAAPAEQGVPALIDLPRLLAASERVEADTQSDDDLELLVGAGSSLGGARPKAHVATGGGRLALAKFPSRAADEWDVPAWEWVALGLAAVAGVAVPTIELISVAGRRVLVVERFDRSGDHRIGFLSAMTMLEAQDGDTRSYLEIADALTTRSPDPDADLLELWRRIALSVLISNTDDHLRNHGFLHAGGDRWRLAPAFDLNPNPEPGARHLRTAIGFDETAARVDLLLEVAGEFRLTRPRALAVLDEVDRAVAGWRARARSAGIARHEIDAMAQAFEHDQRDAARMLIKAG